MKEIVQTVQINQFYLMSEQLMKSDSLITLRAYQILQNYLFDLSMRGK